MRIEGGRGSAREAGRGGLFTSPLNKQHPFHAVMECTQRGAQLPPPSVPKLGDPGWEHCLIPKDYNTCMATHYINVIISHEASILTKQIAMRIPLSHL